MKNDDEKGTENTQLQVVDATKHVLSTNRYEPGDLNALAKLSKVIVESSLAPKHVRSWQDAMLIMKRGAELGLPTQMALENIFVISGKTSMYADAAVALIKGRGHKFDVVESTDEKAIVRTVRTGHEQDGETYSSGKPFEYTFAQAKKAGWTSNKMYSTIPRNMLLARAKMELARMVYEDLLAGVYDPTEMLGGQRVDVEIVRQVAEHYGDRATASKPETVDAEFVESDKDEAKPEPTKPEAKPADKSSDLEADWIKANARFWATIKELDKATQNELHDAFKRMCVVESTKDVPPAEIHRFVDKLAAADDLLLAAGAMIDKFPGRVPGEDDVEPDEVSRNAKDGELEKREYDLGVPNDQPGAREFTDEDIPF